MNFLKLLLVLGIAGGLYQYWQGHREGGSGPSAVAASRNGFVPLPPADGHNAKTVYVIAAENCPHDAAQRADRLAADLSGQGIPVARTHGIQFSLAGGDASAAGSIQAVMNGPLPIVFVRGRAKSNPTVDEVVAEYDGNGR